MISSKLAAKICAVISVKILSEDAIQLRTNESFADIKARFSEKKSTNAINLPVRDWRECLILSYPGADQRSNPAY